MADLGVLFGIGELPTLCPPPPLASRSIPRVYLRCILHSVKLDSVVSPLQKAIYFLTSGLTAAINKQKEGLT